ncbi:MAG: MBL fold metallo-hydrolase [Patescibacteria group bacterium]
MYIEWFGQACLKIQTKPGPNGEVTVIFDPYESAKVGLKLPRLSGDIVAITHDHFDHNYTAGVAGDYFLIKGPGEYEVKQTFIYGVPGYHDNSQGSERGTITMYVLESEGILLAHLGDLGQAELTNEQLEQLEGVDVLILPVGGTYTIDAKQAVEIIRQVEPRIVIPIHYHLPGLKIKLDVVDKFLKAMGVKHNDRISGKYKINKKDLPSEETKVVVLNA